MAEFLLIHGSCYGAWAWDKVIPALSAHGHSVRALDLPGRGGGSVTLDQLARAIVTVLNKPTVLVGHSAGGYAITAAAQMAPGLVSGLIYVAAYVPQPEKSLADLRRAGPSQPMRGAFQLSPDRKSYGFAPDRRHALFFHDCPDAEAAAARLCLEPVAPQETPFPARQLDLPRAAVICTADCAIPPDYQAEMAMDIPQYSLPSGHSPFLSMPAALAALLDQISARFD